MCLCYRELRNKGMGDGGWGKVTEDVLHGEGEREWWEVSLFVWKMFTVCLSKFYLNSFPIQSALLYLRNRETRTEIYQSHR